MASSSAETDLASRGTYRYDALPAGDYIRVLELLPGNDVDILKCRLLPVRLSEQPLYETLSYVWGDPSNPVTIQCGDGTLRIGRSLHAALQRLRRSEESRVIWADAICIDQLNTPERSHQVSQMGQIYFKSQHLNIWLGPNERGDAHAVFSLIRDAATKIQMLWRESGNQYVPWPHITLDNIFNGHDTKAIDGLHQMLRLPWFGRVWIVQESGLSSDGTLRWGAEELKWLDLFTLYMFLHTNRETLGFKASLNVTPFYLYLNYRIPARDRQETDLETSHRSFLDTLSVARSFQATDPKDKVYAFLAYPMALGRDLGEGCTYLDSRGSFTAATEYDITPDYSKLTYSIYTELGVKFLQKSKTLQILHFVKHGEKIVDLLPSWIPRWDEKQPGLVLGTDLGSWYNASRGTENAIPMVQNEHELVVRGLIIDTIRGQGSPFQGYQFLFDEVPGWENIQPGNPLEELMEGVGPILSSIPSPYADIILAFALCLTDGLMGSEAGESNSTQFMANFSAYRLKKAQQLKSVFTNGNEDMLKAMQEAAANGDANLFARQAAGSCNVRRFFFTLKGYLGLGCYTMQPGDLCCVFYSSPIPFIIRPTANKGRYQFVGQAYCHGFMRGEAMDMLERGELVEEEFVLI
jgi:Heterokaryon incompatibility protein (HET)